MPCCRVASLRYWSLPLLVLFAAGALSLSGADNAEKALFEDTFSGELDKDWSWVRESPKNWKLDKEKKELLIHAMPGVSLFGSHSLTNILLREPPAAKDAALAFEVHINHQPTNGYETSGLIWYIDDDNFVTLVKELIDGKFQMILGRKKAGKNEVGGNKTAPYDKDDADMRLIVSGIKVEGQYRAADSDKWQSLGALDVPNDSKARIGLRAGYGPKDKENWARFSKFRIVPVAK